MDKKGKTKLVIFSFLIAAILSISAYAVFVSANTHTSTAIITPQWTKGSEIGVPFTVNITHNGGDEVKQIWIFYNNNYKNFVCGDAPGGWIKYNPVPPSKPYCEYVAEDSTNYLKGGDSLTFTFSADTPNVDGTYIWKIATIDIKEPQGDIYYSYPVTIVDKTAPITNKTYGNPKYLTDIYDWITPQTKITLSSDDGNGIDSEDTYYKVSLLDIKDTTKCIKACDLSFDEGEFTNYDNSFNIKGESCHLIEYYSVDKLGNQENVKKQCVFVDNTPPTIKKEVGAPNISIPDTNSYYIRQDTPITLKCIDNGQHPSGPKTIYWRYRVDGSDWKKFNKDAAEVVFNFPENSVHELEAWCVDNVGLESRHDIEIFRVDSEKPIITKTVGDPKILCKDDDLSKCNYYVRDHVTPINFKADDGNSIHAVGRVTCSAGYWFERRWYDVEKQPIIFNQDSLHTLVITCLDALGNKAVDEEVFNVDSTPPNTTKTYDGPQYPAEMVYPKWISNKTKVVLNAIDTKVEVDKIFWRNKVVEDRYCRSEYSGCQNHPQISETELQWKEYTGPFTKPEESCHLIEYYAVDKLGNNETPKRQCVFVDNSKPETNKTIGEPKVIKDSITYITQNTPITLTCIDSQPHPVAHGIIKYKYNVDGGQFTNWITYEKPFTFKEDSKHTLEYYCEDALGNREEVKSEIDIVETVPPLITKTIIGPKSGNCPPRPNTDDKCYIDGITNITVNAIDPEPHPVNMIRCSYSVSVILPQPSCEEGQPCGGGGGGYGKDNLVPPFTIHFPDESKHILTINCRDELGNNVTDIETFFVDKTPPVTTKIYGTPFFTNRTSDWITSQTPVSFSVEDAGQHKSGIGETKYRKTLMESNEPCLSNDVCQLQAGNGDFLTYSGQPFKIGQESCHLIEYYSVDNVDKKEETKKRCVFVDNTSPSPEKIVGQPKTTWLGDDENYPGTEELCKNGECFGVTTLTPITLSCKDKGEHPVDNEKVCYKVELDGKDATENYCDITEGNMSERGGYCCGFDAPYNFYFGEETLHELDFYCEDALGNKGNNDVEIFKVEGTKFEIKINKKWNLISVPFTLLDKRIEKVFESINESIEAVWTYDGKTGKWFVYRLNGEGTNNLKDINPGWGYWIKAKNSDVLVIGGSLLNPRSVPPTRNLVKGWNLIGYYGTEGQTNYTGPPFKGKQAKCALNSLVDTFIGHPRWSSLWTYWEPLNPNLWTPLDFNQEMAPGAGYWVEMDVGDGYAPATTCYSII